MSNLQLRIISSVVLVVVVVALTLAGGLAFRLLAAAIAGGVFYEWSAMSGTAALRRQQLGAALLLAMVLIALVLRIPAVAVALAWLLGRFGEEDRWTAGGVAYAGLSGVSLGLLREESSAGLVAILFLFAAVWATDVCAYFVGRAVGGPKLAPSISPGKTRSGALGGAVGGVAAAVLVAHFAGAANLAMLALVALLLSVVSQAGDLFESWVKRRHGVKDSGSIIPGHGGVMDRVDGLVAAAVALYVIGALSGSADNPAQALFAIR